MTQQVELLTAKIIKLIEEQPDNTGPYHANMGSVSKIPHRPGVDYLEIWKDSETMLTVSLRDCKTCQQVVGPFQIEGQSAKKLWAAFKGWQERCVKYYDNIRRAEAAKGINKLLEIME